MGPVITLYKSPIKSLSSGSLSVGVAAAGAASASTLYITLLVVPIADVVGTIGVTPIRFVNPTELVGIMVLLVVVVFQVMDELDDDRDVVVEEEKLDEKVESVESVLVFLGVLSRLASLFKVAAPGCFFVNDAWNVFILLMRSILSL